MQINVNRTRLPPSATTASEYPDDLRSFEAVMQAPILPGGAVPRCVARGLIPLRDINPMFALPSESRQPVTQPRSLWGDFIDLALICSEAKITGPVMAGRPDILLCDAATRWKSWVDVSRYFRACGFPLPKERRILVPSQSALESDLQNGLLFEARAIAARVDPAELFFRGDSRTDATGLASLIRLGLTEAHNSLLMLHNLAEHGREPTENGGEGISLAERTDLIIQLLESPQFVGTRDSRVQRPAPCQPGAVLKCKDRNQETPLEIAIRCRNIAMEQILRTRLSEGANLDDADSRSSSPMPWVTPFHDLLQDPPPLHYMDLSTVVECLSGSPAP